MPTPEIELEIAEQPGQKPAVIEPVPDASRIPGPEPFHVALLRSGQHLLRQHPALGLTLGYLFLTAVGMTYEWLFFSEFGLQIFDFADPADFLLVALRKPILLLFTVASVMFLVRLARKHAKWLRKSARYREMSHRLESQRWWRLAGPVCYVGIVAGYFVTFTSAYAEHSAKNIRDGKKRDVWVELVSDPAGNSGLKAAPYVLLGTTTRYVLLYDRAGGRAEVVPVNNVARLSSSRP